MRPTGVVADANVALKWFHADGEESVAPARALLDRHRDGELVAHVLDLTFYEIGNALLRGRARVTAAQVDAVLRALRHICPVIAPDADDLALAASLAQDHELTMYDAVYAAVAQRRNLALMTFDRRLIATGLGAPPA
jgi:predicted nucleic acid-binding protein